MKKFKRIRKLKDYRIHREGTGLLVSSFVVFAIVLSAMWYFLPQCVLLNTVVSSILLVVYLLIVNFFRSPKRIFPGDVEDVVVAPADGKVVVIEKVFEPDHFKDERIMPNRHVIINHRKMDEQTLYELTECDNNEILSLIILSASSK